MRHRLMTCALPAMLALAMSWTAGAQAPTGHIHDLHPASPHGNNDWYTRTSLIANWTGPETVQQNSEILDTLFERRFSNCTCEQVDIEIKEKEERTHQVSVHGEYTFGSSAEAEAKALAASVKASAHSEVTIGAGYTWTKKKTYEVTQNTHNPKCNIKDFKSTIKRVTASGSKDFADHKIVCTCTCGALAVSYCNKQTITSDGIGFHGQDDKWSAVGPCKPCPCDDGEVGGKTPTTPTTPTSTGGGGGSGGSGGSGGGPGGGPGGVKEIIE
jgi:hypothetical protein